MAHTVIEARDIGACALTVAIQAEVWGRDVVVPPPLLRAAVRSGGYVGLGYGPGDEAPGGFVFGFPAIHDGRPAHHSHMLAVLRHQRGGGLARALKAAQRDHCLAQGVGLMTWTMDPLEALNARFNFARLGATARTHLRDHYGEMPDKLNAGLPSDRFEVEWPLAATRSAARLTGTDGPPSLESVEATGTAYLIRDIDGRPKTAQLPSGRALVEIPAVFQSVRRDDPARALEWRLAAREAFEAAFAAGLVATDFLRSADGRGAYLLTPEAER